MAAKQPVEKRKLNQRHKVMLMEEAFHVFKRYDLREQEESARVWLATTFATEANALTAQFDRAKLMHLGMLARVDIFEMPYNTVVEKHEDGKIFTLPSGKRVKRDDKISLKTIWRPYRPAGRLSDSATSWSSVSYRMRHGIHGDIVPNIVLREHVKEEVFLPKPSFKFNGKLYPNISTKCEKDENGDQNGDCWIEAEIGGFDALSLFPNTFRAIAAYYQSCWDRQNAENELLRAVFQAVNMASKLSDLAQLWPEAIDHAEKLFGPAIEPKPLVALSDDDKGLICSALKMAKRQTGPMCGEKAA